MIVDRIVLADPALVWAQTNYTPPDGSYQNINFSTTAANGVGISFIYYFFPAAHTLYYPYINFSHTLPPNSFKFSISVDVRLYPSPFIHPFLMLHHAELAAEKHEQSVLDSDTVPCLPVLDLFQLHNSRLCIIRRLLD